MGAVARVQVIIPYASGVPTDVITNTFHFESLDNESITSAKCATLFSDLVGFYNIVYGGTAIKSMASYLSPANTVMKAYNLSDPPPRTAVREEVKPITPGTTVADTTPAEASVVLSFRTVYQSGINKGSQRGRIYLGGLTNAWFDAGDASRSSRVKQATREAVVGAAGNLFTTALGHKWGWVVYSEKLNQKFAVAGGWIDNAIDTQRRRGQAATQRTTFTT